MGFRRVSEGVSEGFPWVSGGFREKVHIKRITEIIVFAKPWSRGQGFPSASECPYYNIRRTKLTMRTGRGGVRSVGQGSRILTAIVRPLSMLVRPLSMLVARNGGSSAGRSREDEDKDEQDEEDREAEEDDKEDDEE